ncbi:MAG: glycerate kinase type-2 family protein [Fimbriimonadaceae bacterium]
MFGVEPRTRAGHIALDIYAEVLAGVRANVLVDRAVRRGGSLLFVHDSAYDLQHFDRIFVCGAGKAAAVMAASVADVVGDRLAGGLVVTNPAGGTAPSPIRTMAGSHPSPDEGSLRAGAAMLEFATHTTPRDLVLFCLSGGASAVMELPAHGITLDDLRLTTDLLLRSGADIRTLNAVRVRLSRLKGGGLARAFQASVVVLVLSDVLGDDLAVVGSGPFLPPAADDGRAHAVAFGFASQLPPSVQELLTRGASLPTPRIEHFVIGSAGLLWPLASDAAKRHGLNPVGYADPIKGEARAMASKIVRLGRAKRTRGEHDFCMVFAGEPTVTVKGTGQGGRAQEMATQAAAGLVGGADMAFLAAGTDGADGPTDAAGGIVDQASVVEARRSGATVRSALARNDSYHFLKAAGGLIITGPTGTNVNDIALLIHAP